MLKRLDPWIFIPALFLSLLGLLVVYSISYQSLNQQLLFLGISLLVFSLVLWLDEQILKAFTWIAYGSSLILLIATHFFADPTRGSVRWLDFGFLQFQPSEIVKPLLAIAFAFFASRFDLRKPKEFIIFLGLFLGPFLLVLLQPDLGSAMVLASLWGVIALARGVNFKIIVSFLFLVVVAAPLTFGLLQPYQKERLEAFLTPESDPLGSSYNQIQATIAVGSGKIWGKGLGRGIQAHLNFLPENKTDFIFAALAEEFGFVGCLLILGLYLTIFFRLLALAERPEDKFSQLLIIGVFAFMLFQTVVHVAMNIGLLPVTGLTLPFVSLGGSSLVSSWLSLGLVMAVSKSRRKVQGLEIR